MYRYMNPEAFAALSHDDQLAIGRYMKLRGDNREKARSYILKILRVQNMETTLTYHRDTVEEEMRRKKFVVPDRRSDAHPIICSFCGKSQKDAKMLVVSGDIFICDECIELCNEIREESMAEQEKSEPVSDADDGKEE